MLADIARDPKMRHYMQMLRVRAQAWSASALQQFVAGKYREGLVLAGKVEALHGLLSELEEAELKEVTRGQEARKTVDRTKRP